MIVRLYVHRFECPQHNGFMYWEPIKKRWICTYGQPLGLPQRSILKACEFEMSGKQSPVVRFVDHKSLGGTVYATPILV